jgi:hypothetical protein
MIICFAPAEGGAWMSRLDQQDGVESTNTANMYIFNTQARHLNNIAAHDIFMSDHYNAALPVAQRGSL